MIDKEQILQILKNIQDPELKRDIVSLGMIRGLSVHEGVIKVELNLSTPAAAVREYIQKHVKEGLSGLPGVREVQVEIAQLNKAASPFTQPSVAGIRHVVAVASGKGGVGKTTVAVNLALALAQKGNRVGLMDGDIYGPNVPLMLGISGDKRPGVNEQDKIIPIEAHGIKMISMAVLVPADQPMVWRGPMLHSAVTQFVQKVDWGELDFLIVDLPPGTGDVQLSLVQTAPLSGAVIVTTPQEVALMDVRKGAAMFKKTNVPILGVIENMTGEIFGQGGGRKAAEQFEVPFLAEIPLDAKVRVGGDAGKPIIVSEPDSAAAQAFKKAADSVMQALGAAANAR